MDEKILMILVYVHQCVLSCNGNVPSHETMKIFKVEGISGENILGHPQGGNFEFKMMVEWYRKYLNNRDYIMKC